ncbi:MAG: succinate dehydrogenase [Verrucomicrobia bacterium]|nr:succinate dehydrogenase [Verrucomicrobiota bacterium]
MAGILSVTDPDRLGKTDRVDAWWVEPLLTVLGLTAFIVYSTWAAFQGDHYRFGPYLSPFYSPNIKEWFGWNLDFSFAFSILWVPAGFRATCYYYRKAYYRSYFMDPPGCAVGEPHGRSYLGETEFPFILQNLHRCFFYLAAIVLAFLWYDAYEAFFFKDAATGPATFGMGVGTIVLLVNVVTLTGFSFGCNSLRHLIGGKLDCFTCGATARIRHKLWGGVSLLNLRHTEWAWVSLFAVGFADLYVRLCSMGIWHDIRIF